jgi:biopolymer transport protein ExbB/TolQ
MVAGLWPLFLTGAYAMSKRKEKIAAEEREHAVTEAVAATNAAAEEKLAKALEKAEKEKAAAIQKEVKKALEEAAKAKEEDKEEDA